MNIGIENDSQCATHLYQTSSKSSMKSALNNGLSNRNRPFGIENGMLTKLTDFSPAPCKVIDANNIREYPF